MDLPVIDAIKVNDTEIKSDHNEYTLVYNDKQYMYENLESKSSALELQAQIDIAKGHCICTGLGFLIREKGLLNNKDVSEITVIEYNPDVIEIQQALNPDIMKRITVINADANNYAGECDTLLIDHFIDAVSNKDRLDIVRNCCSNIKHKQMIWWDIFADAQKYTDYKELQVQFPTLPDFTASEFYNYILIRK